MYKNKVLSLLFCLSLIFPILLFGAENNSWKDINPNQPISIGEVIYRGHGEKSIDNYKAITLNSYAYDGCDVNSIKIKINQVYFLAGIGDMHESQPDFKSFPLNAKKQALLKVETLNEDEPYKEIMITVVDDFYRIKAEEYRK